MFRSAPVRLALASFALLASACATPVVDESADASGERTHALVRVDRAVFARGDRDPPEPPAESEIQTNVSAKFLRIGAGGDPEAAERVVGSQLDLPAPGTCRVVQDTQADRDELAAAGSIELVDVGDVTLRAGDSTVSLSTRAFPDVGDVVSGVFYTSPDTATELPAPARYALESSGSYAIERFSVEAEAPPPPAEVTVAGAALDAFEPIVGQGSDVLVRWRSESERDLVYVDVVGSSGSVRCTFDDVGSGVVPGALLDEEALGAFPATVGIAVHRVRTAEFGAMSPAAAPAPIDVGEVRFDVAVAGRIAIETETSLDE